MKSQFYRVLTQTLHTVTHFNQFLKQLNVIIAGFLSFSFKHNIGAAPCSPGLETFVALLSL